ncbi:hypothetical protein ASC77_07035 [Nocardioides sp. Root1257]|uniref:purple acid phosphatase family protein n=1 Tax=unclassified Nocardioides TaxID=2615069 RepID=UPI0006F7A060|nr:MULTISPECIES: metallophosphoesterase family protein [unclassified Nocardioides]KQW48502.1 hypothetical protein ASC77_07035 [Nocardioides sp. Root1257]KRC47678.1 hypothetical protein ASE24_07040 [Nocardioides sp. Root224]
MTFISSRRRVGVGLATASLAVGAVVGTGATLAANGADPAAFSVSAVVLGVGTDETSRTVAWYSATDPAAGESVELATKADFSDKSVVPATVTANTTTDAKTGQALTNFNGKVTLSGLKANTTYYYRVAEKGSSSNQSASYSFKTGTFGNGDFQFLFFGDPQIGSSGDPEADGDGWEWALDQTQKQSPKAELYVSGGDQVNTANNETEWDNFLQPDELRSIPWAATIGNHDVSGYAYEQHFALPGTVDRSDSLYTNAASKATLSGGDYWYKWKGVLFIDLNSNAYSAVNGSDPAHVAFVTQTIQAQKDANTKHVVLVYHHSIYSPADHANDTDNQQRRGDFTKAFSDLGVDLVLQGHDHSYSRSYALKGTALGSAPVKADANEQPGQETVVEKVGGVVYVTANSASGSKYYDLTEPDASKGGYGADTKIGGPQSVQSGNHALAHARHWTNSVENQEHVQTYIEVTVNDKGLQVKNIRANDNSTKAGTTAANKTLNPALDRGNVTGVGPELSDWTAPIGSVQDVFSVFRNASDVSPIFPPADVVTKTETVTNTVVENHTVVKEVVPAKVKAKVAAKIKQLTKQVKKAKGSKKTALKAELVAYRAIWKQLH